MTQLTQLFPSDDFTLLGLILVLPLLGAIVNGLFGKRLGRQAVTLLALSAVGVAVLFSLLSFCLLQSAQSEALSAGASEGVRFKWLAWKWLEMGGSGSYGSFRNISLDVAFSVDALSATMILIITGIGFLIHLYSSKYMEEDPSYYRFFTYLNLFIFSMLVLVLGDSLPILFVGWEGVGLCSYLLIGFWFGEEANASAGKKAFITNRIGDFGLLVAMGLLAYYAGALDWAGIETGKAGLLQPVKIWPISAEVPIARVLPDAWGEVLNTPRYVNAATLVGLALFLGCAGKSAQLPLYVWLPDAMAGPTPVSALIHAATMVTAGVYLVCRMAGVFVLSPMAMFIIALVGALTALFAATIALVQNDIKKVLAYSTVSQLGYMFLGVGVGAFVAGFFHVMTHAFFKACLFLGSGSVIHAMHARIHSTEASQDMRNMGGLRKYMPVTFWTFTAAWAAIVGLPFITSGFYSKDEILLKAKTSFVAGPETIVSPGGQIEIDNFVWPTWGPTVLYVIGLSAAILTAFYMTRLVIGTFLGEFRGWTIVPGWKDPHAHSEDHDEHHHEEPGPGMEGPEPHESPWQMTLPLVILGALSIGAGFLSAHVWHITPLDNFLNPLFNGANESVRLVDGHEGYVWPGIALAILAFAGGVGAAFFIYVKKEGAPARALAAKYPKLYSLVYDKWRIDELYQNTVIASLDSLAEMCVWADKYIIDGILARFSAFLISLVGTVLRQFQTGRLQAYAATLVVGLAAIGWYVVIPQANVRAEEDHRRGEYALTAAPGLGYTYRWDLDGDGEWDQEEFTENAQANFQLKIDERRTVRLEVKNLFGRTCVEEWTVVRPRPDLSASTGAAPGHQVSQGADSALRHARLQDALEKGAN